MFRNTSNRRQKLTGICREQFEDHRLTKKYLMVKFELSQEKHETNMTTAVKPSRRQYPQLKVPAKKGLARLSRTLEHRFLTPFEEMIATVTL